MSVPVLLNNRYGKLTAICAQRVGPRLHWVCSCDCGELFVLVRADDLIAGKRISCGCARLLRGGLSESPTYITWAAMRRRCSDRRHPQYRHYGGRGIRVCRKWSNSKTGFASFVRDMGLRPGGLTLDRIDTNSGYCKSNCKWSTIQEQRWNRRDMSKRVVEEQSAEQAHWDEMEMEADTRDRNLRESVE